MSSDRPGQENDTASGGMAAKKPGGQPASNWNRAVDSIPVDSTGTSSSTSATSNVFPVAAAISGMELSGLATITNFRY